MSPEWKQRVVLFAQRFWQPTSACMSCMPGSLAQIGNALHWTTALQTGLVTGLLAVLLSFTPLARFYRQRLGNACMVGGLTMFGDAYAHVNHYTLPLLEPVVTGTVSGLLTYTAAYLLEDRARRLRAVWARWAG